MSYNERRVASEPGQQNGAWPPSDANLESMQESYLPPAAPADEQAAPATTSQPKSNSGTRAIREIVETLLLALVIFVGVRMVVLNFRVDGFSMVPNLHNDEMLLVNRNAYFHFDLNNVLDVLPFVDHDGSRVFYLFDPPERGDIVVLDPPVQGASKPYIKRVIGLPGEKIEFRDGFVYIDGEKLNEPYIDGGITECGGREYCRGFTVPEDSVFVLGDNRTNSSDSRSFGPVSLDHIVGKAWFTYWPSDDIGFVPHYDYPEVSER
jgi:signal peptidase I